MAALDMSESLQVYSDSLRRILALETAYPNLRTMSTWWEFLPAGRPDGLSREARYVLLTYRAARATAEVVRRWLMGCGAEQWVAAVEAETRLWWQREREALAFQGEAWAPPLPELTARDETFAVA